FLLFFFAMYFAYVVEPLIAWGAKVLRGKRGVAIAILYGGLVVGLISLGESVGPRVLEEGTKLSKTLPGLFDQVASGDIVERVGANRWSFQTQQRLKQLLVMHRNEISAYVQSAATEIATLATGLGWVILVPILAVFFLKDKPELRENLLNVFATT